MSGKVESAEICFGVDISAITNNGAPQNFREEIGAFKFTTAEGFDVAVNIPGWDESKTLSGSDDIDTGDAAVAAFISAMESGIVVTGGTVSPTDKAENDITSNTFAREKYRASGPAS